MMATLICFMAVSLLSWICYADPTASSLFTGEHSSPMSPTPERRTLRINGIERTFEADGATLLIDVLRHTLGLRGTPFGCGKEQCGACFVLLDGQAVFSCTT